VSSHAQFLRGNHKDQERNLRRELAELGANVVGVEYYEGPGCHGAGICRSAARAEALGAKLAAETTSRFVRSDDYHPGKNPDVRPSEEDLECLRAWTRGVPLVTLLHPDATPSEERSYQRKRGQRAKGRTGGRPATKRPGSKKRRRLNTQEWVQSLRANGMSIRIIASKTGVPRSTVYDWLP
jgi:hypothetical protein